MGCWDKKEEEPEAEALINNGTDNSTRNVVNESGGFHIIEIHQATAGNLAKACAATCCCCFCACGLLACMYRVYRRGVTGMLCPPTVQRGGGVEPYRGAAWRRDAYDGYGHAQIYRYDQQRFQELPPEDQLVRQQPLPQQMVAMPKRSPPLQRVADMV